MSTEKKAYLACDTAYEHGIVALFDKDDLLFFACLSEKMAHGKNICSALEQALSFAKENNIAIAALFCGLGPGSFVGIRVALATALGFTFAKNLPLIGFCSHEALANSANQRGDFFVFMKASGDLGYLTGFTSEQNIIRQTVAPVVVAISEVSSQIGGATVIISDMAEKLSPIVDSHITVVSIVGPSAFGIRRASLNRLQENSAVIDESASIKPNYIKPPNVSLPKKAFVIDLQAA